METSTKNQNEQQKAITSNKRHLPVLVFEIELILKNKKEQRRAAKGNERQMETLTKNQNEQQKETKSTFHSHFHSFAPILDLWKVIDIKSNEKPERATTGNEKQWKAAKSYEEQQKATTDIRAGKTKTGKKKPRRAMKGTKSPNGNQALVFEIELILPSPKTRTSNEEQQKATNGKWKHALRKTSNKKQQITFFIPIFIHLLQLWTYGRWLTLRAIKNQREQQRGNEKQRKAKRGFGAVKPSFHFDFCDFYCLFLFFQLWCLFLLFVALHCLLLLFVARCCSFCFFIALDVNHLN